MSVHQMETEGPDVLNGRIGDVRVEVGRRERGPGDGEFVVETSCVHFCLLPLRWE